MVSRAVTYLMYHELEVPNRALRDASPGYIRYVVKEQDYADQLRIIVESGFRGMNVSEALRTGDEDRAVCFTFDDGCETDLLVAAPLLRQYGLGATFYLVAGFINTPGYLSASQVRELHALGFEIGSHSMTHSYLPRLSDDRLRAEIFESKDRLEQLCGDRVNHFSCPGGRWQPRMSKMVKAAGYLSLATSEIGTNSILTDRYRLRRVAIFRGTSAEEVLALCEGRKLFTRRLQSVALGSAKALIGDANYEKAREGVLKHLRRSQTDAFKAPSN